MVLDNRFQATLCIVSRTSLFKQILFEFECRAENFLLSVQFEEECLQQASMSDGCDLTLSTRTQTSHREHNDLTSSNRRSSTLLPQTLPKRFRMNPVVCFLEVYGAPFVKILYLTDLAQKLLSLRIFSYLCAEIAVFVLNLSVIIFLRTAPHSGRQNLCSSLWHTPKISRMFPVK